MSSAYILLPSGCYLPMKSAPGSGSYCLRDLIRRQLYATYNQSTRYRPRCCAQMLISLYRRSQVHVQRAAHHRIIRRDNMPRLPTLFQPGRLLRLPLIYSAFHHIALEWLPRTHPCWLESRSTAFSRMTPIATQLFSNYLSTARMGRFPIVQNNRTIDTGLDLNDAAMKTARSMAAISADETPWIASLHAAAVSRGDHGVLIPAIGGSGKTTLAAYLVAQGYCLVNDDMVVLRETDMKFAAAPMAMSIKAGAWPLLNPYYAQLAQQPMRAIRGRPVRYLPPSRHQICHKPVDCRLVILPDYSSAHETAGLTPVSHSQVFKLLVEGGTTFNRPISKSRLASLINWLSALPCYRMHYSALEDAHELVELCLDELTQ